jgi:hypothetical protein
VTGSGTVTSSPLGISCGADCSENYASGTSVSLMAAAASGYSFAGWSGACSGTAGCTVSMTAARSVSARFTANQASASANLCEGLVTDKVSHAMGSLARPGVGQAVTDPAFGTTVRRLTDAGGTNVIKPAYSTIPAWNADESYLILYHTGGSVRGGAGHHLYNGKTYQYIRALDIDPPDLEQFYWHGTNPNLLLYIDSGTRLVQYNVVTGTKTTLKTFSCSVSGGADPMYTSWDSDLIGLRCGSQMFTYRVSTNTEYRRVSESNGLAPIAAPSGTLAFYAAANAQVRDLDLNILRTLAVVGEEHASLGRLASGVDTHNTVSFDGSYVGSLVTSDMTGASAPRVIVGPSTGYPYPPGSTHVSAVSLKNPGWVAVSIVGNTDGKATLNQEIVLANTNPGGQVCRVAHHRSYGKAGPRGYWAEPHVVISPSGTRLLFGSDWGGGSSVDAYVVELPSYQP